MPGKFVSRSEWGARPRKGDPTPLSTDLVTIHWEGPHMGTFPHSSCAGKVKGIQDFHMDVRKWRDIAYSGVVCPHGYVFEGRGRGVETGANGTNTGNDSAYALCALVGEGDPITPALVDGLSAGVAWLGGKETNGHRDWKPTKCPGDELYRLAHDGTLLRGNVEPSPPSPPKDEEMTEAEFRKAFLELIKPLNDRVLRIETQVVGREGDDGKFRTDRIVDTLNEVHRATVPQD